MSRDYKSRSTTTSAKPAASSRGGTLIGIFVGLVIGVLLAAGVVWYMNKTPVPFVDKTRSADKPAKGDAAGKDGQPLALPGKPGDPVPGEKPRFDFYKILPGQVEATPDGKADAKKDGKDAAKDAKDAKDDKSAPKEVYWLQAGSFQNASDADNVKARLALMGIETQVQQVMVPDKGNFHRVRVGPYSRIDDVNKMRANLAKNGIEANLVKEKSN